MLKVKNTEKKTGSPSKPKGPKVLKKPNDTNKLKKKPNNKGVKKAVEEGLIKPPGPAPPKVGASPVKKPKVLDEKALAAKKEKQKLKNIQKKLNKAAAKQASVGDISKENQNAAEPQKDQKKKTEENGSKTEATAVAGKKSQKKNKQNKNTDKKVPVASLTSAQTIFVGNLPTNTKRVQIVKLFASYAPIQSIRIRTASGKVIFKHKARKESGSLNAYIVFQDEETAAKALELNGTEFKGNILRVTKSEKTDKEVDNKLMIFVGNLKYSCTDDKLRQIFSSCGEIEYVRTIQAPENDKCKGVAYVCFKNADSVGLALELDGTVLDERPIHVERYTAKKLGAKQKREEAEKLQGKAPHKGKGPQNGKGPQKSKGPQKGKGPQNGKGPHKSNASAKKGNPKNEADDGKKKKSEFRGVKTEINKKKQKKPLPSAMKKLAKKIAPKSDD